MDQCECGRPVPHIPHERGFPLHASASGESPPPLDAKTDNFLVNRFDPHLGQGVPVHLLERMRISLSVPHFPQ
ncbi:MAG TPA: hypothetical protein VMR33_09750 [Candidatus Baltobacteraceae bacterium]|nr:hypothetical protein [Candidatus Baltobacteraceae bacterium]